MLENLRRRRGLGDTERKVKRGNQYDGNKKLSVVPELLQPWCFIRTAVVLGIFFFLFASFCCVMVELDHPPRPYVLCLCCGVLPASRYGV